MSEEQATVAEEKLILTWSDFLESHPPGSIVQIADLVRFNPHGVAYISAPELQLHCNGDKCNGVRFFSTGDTGEPIVVGSWKFAFLTYKCRNCDGSPKTFAVAVIKDKSGVSGQALKFGEWPPFGPPTPSRLIKLIGPERELFLSGRRCENQGLGIGAFVYYRRVVEGQKNRILDEIIKVSKQIGAPEPDMNALAAAKAETQFSRSIDLVKNAIPQSLLVNGHNPLTLLHNALSEGLHADTDEMCLELASSIRVVLAELAERLQQALKDEAELNTAVTRLLNKK
jgi:hypothetical protein